jgi:LuxR family maltose regulon positive regulatory protein
MNAVRLAMPMEATHAGLLLARAALSLGQAQTARRYLSDAKRVIDSIDDVGVMREQHAELNAQLEAHDPEGEEHPDPDFTERELEVLALLSSPLTTREIGEELFLSRNTIKTYLRRLYRKLDASSRDEAVMIGRERGLLPAPDDRQPPA